MTGKPPHRPVGKTDAQEWSRKDPHVHRRSEPDVRSFKDTMQEDVDYDVRRGKPEGTAQPPHLPGARQPRKRHGETDE